MKNQQKVEFLILLTLIKKYQLSQESTNISMDNLLLFLDKFYFSKSKFTKRDLVNFVKEDNNKVIVDFLWAEAIINPEI